MTISWLARQVTIASPAALVVTSLSVVLATILSWLEMATILLFGGVDNDRLDGGVGNDTLDGGICDDTLSGGTGNNIYLFGKGDGQDVISSSNDQTITKLNTLQFKEGVLASEMIVTRVNNDLLLSISGSTDKVTVQNFFQGDNPAAFYNPVQLVKFNDGSSWNIATLASKAMAGDDTEQILIGLIGDDVINGLDGDDKVNGQAGNDALDGGSGNDLLGGGEGNDLLYGGIGNDTLNGDTGDDTLDGGRGDDFLNGGAGNNIYLFGKGDGQDLISSSNDQTSTKLNTLQFKEGVTASELIVTRVNSDLVLSIMGTTDKLTLQNFFLSDNPAAFYNPVQLVKFSDGSSWDIAALVSKAMAGDDTEQILTGLTGDDVINALGGDDKVNGQAGHDTLDGGSGNDLLGGGEGNDLLYGGIGNDTLNGDTGDDTLDGGRGDDFLNGGAGNNIYLFGKGDGQDLISSSNDQTSTKLNTLQFKEGVTAAELIVTRVNSDLVLSIMGTTDKLTLQNFFLSDNPAAFYNPVQLVKFSDGSSWDIAALVSKAMAGDDTEQILTGLTGDDVINALGGDDKVNGQAGHDTLDGGSGNDLLGGGEGNDLLYGGIGNDTLNGDTGDDTLDGGRGDDFLNGGAGNNIYLFGKGDGQDVISSSSDSTTSKLNTLRFKEGVLAAELIVTRVNSDLVLSISGSTDKVTLLSFFASVTQNPIQSVIFNDGTSWDIATIKSKISIVVDENLTLNGSPGDDVINALGGNDTVSGQVWQ